MASVTLTHTDINSGSPVKIECSSVTVAGSKNLDSTPDVNIQTGPVEVQTQSFENLSYTVSGVHYLGNVDTLTWTDVIALYKSKYSGSNYATLNITTGQNIQKTQIDTTVYSTTDTSYELLKSYTISSESEGTRMEKVVADIYRTGTGTGNFKVRYYFTTGTFTDVKITGIASSSTTTAVFNNPLEDDDWVYKVELYAERVGAGTEAFIENINLYYNNRNLRGLIGLGGSTDIKVVLKTPTLPITVKDTKNGYMPIGTLTFMETS